MTPLYLEELFGTRSISHAAEPPPSSFPLKITRNSTRLGRDINMCTRFSTVLDTQDQFSELF